jgi:hypothetical protein
MALAGLALLAAIVLLVWFVVRVFRSAEKKVPMKMRNFDLGYHLVAYLDVQGQREKFRGLRLPKNQEEAAAVGEVPRQTAGFVLELRQAFDEQFERFEAGATSMMRRQTEQPVRSKFAGFSDSFIASVPLRNDAGDLLPIVTGFSAPSAAWRISAIICLFATSRDTSNCFLLILSVMSGPKKIARTATTREKTGRIQASKSPVYRE